jgi:hypothetical protein
MTSILLLLRNAVLLSIALLPAHAALITFSTRAAFESAVPDLATETFEAGLVSAGAVTTCNGPLTNAAGSACFTAGTLLPGVSYNASGNAQPNMVVLGANFPGVGNLSKIVGPNSFADTFNVTFAMADAVGFDVYPGPAAGNVVISAFSPAEMLLGSFTIAAPIGATFFGVLNDSGPIGRINIASQSPSPGEVIDNLSFGTAIPQPSSLLLSGGALLVITGLQRKISAVQKRRSSRDV